MRRGLVLVVLLALGLGACGGGDGGSASGDRLTKAEYEQEIAAIGKTFSEGLGGVSNAQSPEEISDRLSQAKDQLDAIADKLDDVSPPEEIEEAHDKLVSGVRSLSEDLDEIGPKLEDAAQQAQDDKNPAALLALFGELASLDSIKQLQAVNEEFKAKGYDLGLNDAAGATSG